MKTHCQPNFLRRGEDAFTLAEFMVMSGIFMLVIAAVMASHLYGLKMSTRIGIKLGVTDDARQAVSLMIGDIRGAQSAQVGNGDANGFTNVADGTSQSGNALLIYPGNTTNLAATNIWIRYYYSGDPNNTGTNVLMRYCNDGSARLVTANYVTNYPPIFQKLDYTTNVSTNINQTPYSIQVTLSFIRLANPQVPIGPSNMYNFYQVVSRISPRNQ